ncbi:LysM peptidoglycan-binding domain-containing protein [Arthrobacter cavernae]|uniref:LysM peptidoglycan-binding domain-containing protein n=1 Tax=Arthrobacter cavernae TaxID=2817681 RepID=A0A939HLT6_9MICC|nr:LysM domain-containing protein [Arthrobacter cavernae]MBO1269633.1 LysM peptidoglycan-binding domain-containing protein [Arthrobacter cavernae]
MGLLDDLKKNLGFAHKEQHKEAQTPAEAHPEARTDRPENAAVDPAADSTDDLVAESDTAAADAAAAEQAAAQAATEQAAAQAAAQQAAADAAAQQAAAEQAAAAQAAAARVTEVVVEPGDTLSGIAVQFGVDLGALIAANADTVPNPDLIYPGQVLRLP